MRILSDEEARWFLYRKTRSWGRVAELSRQVSCSPAQISAQRNGHETISKKIAEAVGLRKVWIITNPKDEELFNGK